MCLVVAGARNDVLDIYLNTSSMPAGCCGTEKI